MNNSEHHLLRYFINEDLFYIQNDNQGSEQEKEVPEKKREKETIVGKNVVITTYSGSDIPGTDKKLLFDIFKAVNIPAEEAVIINLWKEEEKFEDTYEFQDCRILGFMESVPDQLIHLFGGEHYKIAKINTNSTLLSAPLNELQKDISGKRSLWNQLQVLYDLS